MADKDTVDVLVIGGGPGGTPAALMLAQARRKVMLVEAGRGLGGTCLFEGCIPSKIYRETAARRQQMLEHAAFGIDMPQGMPQVDWRKVMERREHILSMRSGAALQRARKIPTLDIVFGRARFTGPRSAVVETREGAREVAFEKAIIATGSLPNRLPIPGADLPGVLDSTGLVLIDHIPRSLVLIGGGPIGVEMAQIFHMLGTERVAILEYAPRILGPVDAVLAQRLMEILREKGIEIVTNARVQAIEQVADGLAVRFRRGDDGAEETLAAQHVGIVAGRRPNVEGLGLGNTAIRHDAHGIHVNEVLETDEPGIFATGDVIGQPMFAHWATMQAQAVARHLLGLPAAFPKPEHNSAVIFSSPELGMAGLTEEAARARGWKVAVAEYDYRVDARAQISFGGVGMVRIVYREDDGVIVGVHALVENASELMGEAAAIVRNGLTLQEVALSIHPHPTLTEGFRFAALQAMARRMMVQRAASANGGTA